jgi:hypothetical protein
MGVNNKQRRAAKQRKRGRQRGPKQSAGGRQDWFGGDPAGAAYAWVDLMVTTTVRRISRRKLDKAELEHQAEAMVRRAAPQPRLLVEEVLGDLLARLADGVVRGGWGPADLAELVRRNAEPRHLPVLAAVLHEEARRHRRYGPGWLAALEAVAPEARLRLDTNERLASGLAVAALLASAPLLDADAVTRTGGPGAGAPEHPKLAKVRGLLAKAESTDFEDEAEALTAKAQELISRYALKRLLSQSQAGHQGRGDEPEIRRIWLDAPYVMAKAALVDEVAGANRCRTAVTERLGFCVVIGARADLDAVELLVTSLLVQADTAMLRHGRRVDRRGASRTRSFRQSFLVAFAHRIGDRLRAATAAAAAAEDESRLLPVLRDHNERVDAAFDAMLPHVVQKTTSVSNGEGWEAGLAAADLALLDVNGRLPEAAG